MKTINVYFGAVNKVSKGHIDVEDDVDIEVLLKAWMEQGYAKVHYMSNRIFAFIPWANVVYCAYAD